MGKEYEIKEEIKKEIKEEVKVQEEPKKIKPHALYR